jgi:hypothetical protein
MAIEGDNGIFIDWINRQYLDSYSDDLKVIVRIVEEFS